MSEAVPLSSALCVHSVKVVISHILSKNLDLMLEDFPAKGWLRRAIERQVHRNDFAGFYFLGRSGHACRSEKIQTANLQRDEQISPLSRAVYYAHSHCLPIPKQPRAELLGSEEAPFEWGTLCNRDPRE